jgi:UDP-2,3-diacylglucosamine hydrolase
MTTDPDPREIRGDLGLIAGAGRLPAEAAKALEISGQPFEVYGFEGITDSDIGPAALRTKLGQFERLAEHLKGAHRRQLLIVGNFSMTSVFEQAAAFDPDPAALRLLALAGDGQELQLMTLVGDWLAEQGFDLLRQDQVLASLLAGIEFRIGRFPTEEERGDAWVGYRAAESLGRSELGQAVAVKKGVVIARETIDGTDEMIRRAGEQGGNGVTIVKRTRPGQDRRFDLPAIGPGTIEAMRAAGATALAVEAGSTLIVDRSGMSATARAADLAIWAFDPVETLS